jgi:hypothetical protein
MKKSLIASLFLVPVAATAFAVACQPVTSSTTPPAPASSTASPAPVTPVPVTTTASPVPVTTTASPSAQCHFRYDAGNPLPDPRCTPGAVQSTSVTAICASGWATAHREYFTKAEREVAFARYGVITLNPVGYGEYDHLIPLELGGANSPDNLWPEKGKIPNAKDAIENTLHEEVCAGKVSLAAAQSAIASDWVTAETVLGI